jgi:hypothetical protein
MFTNFEPMLPEKELKSCSDITILTNTLKILEADLQKTKDWINEWTEFMTSTDPMWLGNMKEIQEKIDIVKKRMDVLGYNKRA